MRTTHRTQSGSTTDNADSAGTASYYLADGLGSTTQLVDNAGSVTDTYTYDVFGALRSSSGSTTNPFDFAGQQTDHTANRGLQYLRARHYDPALGRFLGRDAVPFAGRYAYAANDPVNAVDPSGRCLEPASAAALSGSTAVETAGAGPAISLAIFGGIACYATNCGQVAADVVSDALGAFGSFFSRGSQSPASRRKGMARSLDLAQEHIAKLEDDPCSFARNTWVVQINSFIKNYNRDARKLGEEPLGSFSGEQFPCNEQGPIAVPLPLNHDSGDGS